jgi:5'-nucleotidase
MNAGGVRNPGFIFNQQSGTEAPGEVTYGEAFTVQPFGNSLVTLTLTGQQIKDLLEQQFPGCLGQTNHTTFRFHEQLGCGLTLSGLVPARPRKPDVSTGHVK